jgi:hypothetical protein
VNTIERTITLYIGAVAEIGDGCQLALFDSPRVNGSLPAMFIPDSQPSVHQGDLIEIALSSGRPFPNGEKYRINDGPWITFVTLKHTHDVDSEYAAIRRACDDLKVFQNEH